MKLIKSLLIISILLTAKMLTAQEQPYKLTLEDARNYALQHNKNLLNARDNLKISKEKVREVTAQGLPQVNGTVDYMTYFNYELNFSFGGGGDVTLPDFTQPPYDMGDQALFYAIMGMFGSSSGPIVMSDQLNANVQVSQLIFSGQYWAGLQTAKIARTLSEQNVTRTEQDVVENITNSYYNTLVTEQSLRILKENITDLETILEHTRNMFNTGIWEKVDVDQLRVTLNQLKNTQASVERYIQLNYNMMRFQLGVEPSAKIELAENLDQLLTKDIAAQAVLGGYDLTSNINYQMSESQTLLSKKQVSMQSWAYAPTIAGFYSYTEKILTTGFDMQPKNLVGVNMSVPIFSSGMRRAQLSQAKVNYDIAQRNQEMAMEQLELTERQLVFNYQSALENFNTQKENVDVAKSVFENFQNKYKQGLFSSVELTQANSNLLAAESNYISSVQSLLQAQTALDKLYNRF